MITAKVKKNKAAVVLIVALFFLMESFSLLFSTTFELWDAQLMDRLYRLRGLWTRFTPSYDKAIVHVDINNTTIRHLNDFYLNRGHYAVVVENLGKMEVAAQGYDFIFAAPSNAVDDAALIRATASAGNVYYGMALSTTSRQGPPTSETLAGTDPQASSNLPAPWTVRFRDDAPEIPRAFDGLPTFTQLSEVSRGLGFLNIRADGDGVFRRVPLLVRGPRGVYPSLPFRILCDYFHVSPESIEVGPGRKIVLKSVEKPGGATSDLIIPVDDQGSMLINFIGPWESMTHYNFSDVFHARRDDGELALWKSELSGKLVMVSDVSTGSTDLGPVPTDPNFPLSGLHANVINTILTGEFLTPLSQTAALGMHLFLLLAVLCLALIFQSSLFPVAVIGLGVMGAGAVGAAFLYGRLVVPLIVAELFIFSCTLCVSVLRYVLTSREREVLRKTFEAYFPPAVLEKVIQDPEHIASRVDRKELTILFSDIKNFTHHSANLSPEAIRLYLNEYFDSMVEIVFRHQGTVDKYLGDGLMVYFGDPEPLPDHALRCVRAAMEMQSKAGELRRRWEKEGGMPLEIRIGINTGEVVVGNMGSMRRLSYTVLGAAVNLTQRLESSAPTGGILLSERTAFLVENEVPIVIYEQLKLKGFDKLIKTYRVILDGA